ncbi:TonB-dependent receptor [Chitinophaga arvensicola]|uniref:Iron complex outermembrane recepter protein n=1 Tax=Chitinophaga arvensicola TaxID=29529 RepID=A0A1I0SBE7_9BACT|nr:TonB-dependent receptor [Chitinophaga arvensicola]SEW53973.1 iron complex outermembrane recepter protein [Chitinophaga arvensicola]
MKQISLFLLLLILPFTFTYAGLPEEGTNNTIQGVITTSDGSPATNVTVMLKGISKGMITNQSGEFLFRNVPDGTYQLEVSMIGFESIHRTVTVGNGKSVVLQIELKTSSRNLEEIVIATGGNRFAKKESEDVSKLPLRNLENPQVYSVVGKELMKEQLVTDYNSAFKNIPGAGIPIVYNQGRSSATSRGFTTANLVRNGVGSFVYTSVDPANLERIEVIKGPSATLFGSTLSSFGGLFNRVTKKPFENFKGEVSYSGGSWDLNRLTLDINTPVNEEKTALFRINGAIHSERSFQDAGFSKNYLLAPSFSYKVNDRLTILLDAEMSGYKATSPMRMNPYTKGKAHSITEMDLPYKLSFANNSMFYNSQQLNVFGQIKYKLSGKWTSQTVFSRTRSTSDGFTTQVNVVSDSTLRQAVTSQTYPYYGTDIQQNFIGDFHIGNLRNRLVVGVDFYSLRASRNDTIVNMPAMNYRKPGDAYNNFNRDNVTPMFAKLKFLTFDSNRENTYSAYFSDVINVTDKLLVMASLRLDNYHNLGAYYASKDSTVGNYTQTALSPKFGIVYQLIKDRLSVFGNYMNGFQNQSGTDYDGNTFKPQQANQVEGGIKADLFNEKLNVTLSYYDISVTNSLYDDPAHGGFSLQNGTQLSKGFEAEVIANPVPGLNIVAGYTYNESKMDKADAKLQGLRPASAGPATLANLWVSYRLVQGSAKGLGFAFGGNYGSQSFQTNTNTFAFTIPSYTVLDASVFYDRPVYRLGLKVDNLTNEKYWSARLAAQPPTRITANMTIKF